VRPIIKSVRINEAGNPLEIDPWSDAKQELILEIGTFCSFCEKYNSRSALHVEHIKGRNCRDANDRLIYDQLKYRWDNFLLACVNCNSVKGSKDILSLNPFMPHENNLMHFLEVVAGGIIRMKDGVAGLELNRTQAFLDLIGLDRIPGHHMYSDKDDRWDSRLKVFDIASRQRQKYTAVNRITDIETIIDLAKTNGFFSVWYYVFQGVNDVIDALINGTIIQGVLVIPFPGIHATSFDASNGNLTLPRP